MAREIQRRLPGTSYTRALRLLREYNERHGEAAYQGTIAEKIDKIVAGQEPSNDAGGDGVVSP